eukprot:15454738-Alexandrium_andersonii.AAC.1
MSLTVLVHICGIRSASVYCERRQTVSHLCSGTTSSVCPLSAQVPPDAAQRPCVKLGVSSAPGPVL